MGWGVGGSGHRVGAPRYYNSYLLFCRKSFLLLISSGYPERYQSPARVNPGNYTLRHKTRGKLGSEEGSREGNSNQRQAWASGTLLTGSQVAGGFAPRISLSSTVSISTPGWSFSFSQFLSLTCLVKIVSQPSMVKWNKPETIRRKKNHPHKSNPHYQLFIHSTCPEQHFLGNNKRTIIYQAFLCVRHCAILSHKLLLPPQQF